MSCYCKYNRSIIIFHMCISLGGWSIDIEKYWYRKRTLPSASQAALFEYVFIYIGKVLFVSQIMYYNKLLFVQFVVLAEDAIKAALSDYRIKQSKESRNKTNNKNWSGSCSYVIVTKIGNQYGVQICITVREVLDFYYRYIRLRYV